MKVYVETYKLTLVAALLALAAVAVLLAACGGGSPDANTASPNTASQSRVAVQDAESLSTAGQYVVTASGPNLVVSPPGRSKAAAGSQLPYTVTPRAGHVLLNNVGGTCAPGSWNGSTYLTGPIEANCTVTFNASSGVVRYSAAPGNGTPGHAGTLADPYQTVWENIKAANAGDVIYLLPGTFTECPYLAKSGSAGMPIVMMGAGTIPAKGAPAANGTTINCVVTAQQVAANEASGLTGAVYMIPTYVTVQNLTIGPSPQSGSGLFINAYGGAPCSNVVVDHVTIHDTSGAGYQSVLCGALTLTNSVFYNNGLTYQAACTSGISLGGNVDDLTANYDNLVDGNVSYNNGNPATCNPAGSGFNSDGEGIIVDYGPGTPCMSYTSPNNPMPPRFHCATVSRTQISNNVFYGNQSAGIEVYNGDNVDIVNNTLYQNQTVADHTGATMGEIMILGVAGSNATSVTVSNNLIVPLGSHPPISCREFSDVAIDNNFYSNTALSIVNADKTCSNTQSGNVSGTAGFVDPSVPNFQLQASSGARNIGLTVTGVPFATWLQTDYTGTARSAGAAPDAGACQYAATSPKACP